MAKLVSDQLREAIRQSDKSRYRISQETGIPQSALSRFVNGQSGLWLDSIDKLCECLDVGLTEVPSAKRGAKKRK